MIWYDGGILPLHDDRFRFFKFPANGALVVGENGMIIHGSHGAGGYAILRDKKRVEVAKPAELLERSKGHHQDWIDAIKTGKQASASFDYGGPLTETVLLGVAASRFRNQELEWDSEKMKVTNFEAANAIITPEFRNGWKL